MKIKNPKNRGKRTKIICQNCGEEYLELDIKLRAGKGKFCSNKCYQEYRRKHSRNENEANRLYQKKNKYGLLEEEYYSLFKVQGNKCAICGKEFDEVNIANVDHSHESNKVRGLLCRDCNLLLGHAHDNVEILKRAIDYLNNAPISVLPYT